MRRLRSAIVGLYLLFAAVVSCKTPHTADAARITVASAQPCQVEAQLQVLQLPNTPVIDMTKPLPPIPGAMVEVAEIGVKERSDPTGNVRFNLHFISGVCERVYTFAVTVPGSQHQSVTRLLISKATPDWLLFFDAHRDLYLDNTFKRPPKAPVTVVVLDSRGVFPLQDAVVTIAELGLSMKTDQHGEVDLLIPLGGPCTFDVTVPGSPIHTSVRRGVFRQPETDLIIRFGGENPIHDEEFE
jgi:hypothetical protein